MSKVQGAYVQPLAEPPRELPVGVSQPWDQLRGWDNAFFSLGWTGQFAQEKGTNYKPASETGQLSGMS